MSLLRHGNVTGLRRYVIIITVAAISIFFFYVLITTYIAWTIPPDKLLVYEITEEKAREGIVIRLDDETFRDLPVLDTVLRGEGYDTRGIVYRTGDIRFVGGVDYPKKIRQETIDTYMTDTETGRWKYFEYEGRYYRVGTLYRD